jgi:RNA polymerase sigma factor for flagellar operon FliA
MSAQVYQQVRAHAQRDELILGHLPLVRHIIGRLAAKLPHGIDVENLEAAGTLGLVEAANRYDSERGIQFKTFAYTRIRGAIYDELRRNCPLPQELLERIAVVRKVLESMAPPIRVDEVAQQTGLSEDDVNECMAALRLTRSVSWDGIAEPGDGSSAGAAERPDAQLEVTERKHLLAEAISGLPENERLAITLYYMEDLRLKEIGRVLQLSESRVSRLLKAAEQRIEEHIRAKEADAA